jgi:hypothetical protein
MHHDATPNGPVQAGTKSRARAIVMREVFKHLATAETLSPAAILARTSSRCTTISGFDTLAGCQAAEPTVVAFYKKTTASNVVRTECVELPR